jgi:hypothetical protein
MAQSWHRIAVIGGAVPVFLFFPVAVALLAMTGKQLIWGFDDMPIGAMLAGLLVGGIVGLTAFILVSRLAWRGMLCAPLLVIIAAAAFDCTAIPVSRYITERVEHPQRFSTPPMEQDRKSDDVAAGREVMPNRLGRTPRVRSSGGSRPCAQCALSFLLLQSK